MNGIISAKTLFHFTKNKENLLGILQNGFYPRCCMENVEFVYESRFKGGFTPTEIAIPMVCFCDIPLSQIGNHIKEYGGYAVGMSKEWGENNGINPVMYELSDSNPIRAIRSSLDKTILYINGQYVLNEEGDRIKEIGDKLTYFSCFIKPYKGKKWNKENNEFGCDIATFYDEREWRYVPDLEILQQKLIAPYIRKDDFLQDQLRDDYNSKLQVNFKLSFSPGDLNYIIVNTEDEVLDIAKEVWEIKGRLGYDDDQKKHLLTKIISTDKLKDDI
jgi:hypothetical protein